MAVPVEKDHLAVMLVVAARYVAGEQPPAGSTWADWLAEMFETYALAAGFDPDRHRRYGG